MRRPIRVHFFRWLPLILVAAFIIQALLAIHLKSVTPDEISFIAAGYAHLHGEVARDPQNPPLMMIASALPLLPLNLELHPKSPAGYVSKEYGSSFLFFNTRSTDLILFLARLGALVVGCALALLVWHWARQLYGAAAGLLALFLCAFSPSLIAFGSVSTLDLGGAFFICLALYAFWEFCRRPGLLRLLAVGVATGLAFSAKSTAMLLIPSFAMLGAFACLRDGGVNTVVKGRTHLQSGLKVVGFWSGCAAIIVVCVILVINLVYGFRGTGTPLGELSVVKSEAFQEHRSLSRLINPVTEHIPSPLPPAYVESLARNVAMTTVKQARPGYLLGHISTRGWWYYYPVAFFLKTPFAFLLLLALAVAAALMQRPCLRRDDAFVLIPAGLMFYLACSSSIQIGIRHILVIYPLLFVFAGRLALISFRRVPAIAVSALLGIWLVVETLWACPNYLSYFSAVAGGSDRGRYYLLDSNLDWGQDIKGLVSFMDRRGIERVQFGHWTIIEPRYSDRFSELPYNKTEGWVAIQANCLMGLTSAWGANPTNAFEWLKLEKPVATIGGSILVYHLPGRMTE